MRLYRLIMISKTFQYFQPQSSKNADLIEKKLATH